MVLVNDLLTNRERHPEGLLQRSTLLSVDAIPGRLKSLDPVGLAPLRVIQEVSPKADSCSL